MHKISVLLAIVVVASTATTSAAVFSSKQRAADVATAVTEEAVAKVDAIAPPVMTMQRPI